MTVREMMSKLSAMIDSDPTVADLDVDSEGCDCIDAAEDVYVFNGKMLVAREADEPAHVEPLSEPAMELLKRLEPQNSSEPTAELVAQRAEVIELRTRGFVVYKFGPSHGRWVIISDAGRAYLKDHT